MRGYKPMKYDTLVRILGWGMQERSPGSNALQVARKLKGYSTLTVECNDAEGGREWVRWVWPNEQPMFICTTKAEGGACDGDLGGEQLAG